MTRSVGIFVKRWRFSDVYKLKSVHIYSTSNDTLLDGIIIFTMM